MKTICFFVYPNFQNHFSLTPLSIKKKFLVFERRGGNYSGNSGIIFRSKFKILSQLRCDTHQLESGLRNLLAQNQIYKKTHRIFFHYIKTIFYENKNFYFQNMQLYKYFGVLKKKKKILFSCGDSEFLWWLRICVVTPNLRPPKVTPLIGSKKVQKHNKIDVLKHWSWKYTEICKTNIGWKKSKKKSVCKEDPAFGRKNW